MGRALLPVDFNLLKSLFCLPEDFRIIGSSSGHNQVQFILESKHISERATQEELPKVVLKFTLDTLPGYPEYRKITVIPTIDGKVVLDDRN